METYAIQFSTKKRNKPVNNLGYDEEFEAMAGNYDEMIFVVLFGQDI